jgi:hypothetical protein
LTRNQHAPAPVGGPQSSPSGDLASANTVIGAPDEPAAGELRLGLILARTETLSLGIAKISVYPSGFAVDLFLVREDDETELETPLDQPHRSADEAAHEAGQTLSFELRYADGRSLTNIRPAYAPHNRRDEPITRDTPRADTVGGRPSFWVQPLPPRGPLTISCRWAAVGIPPTEHTLDAQDILDAAHQGDERKSRAPQPGREHE